MVTYRTSLEASVLVLLVCIGLGHTTNISRDDDVKPYNVTEGQDFKVTCTSSSAIIEWTNDKGYKSTGKDLHISHIKRDMSGKYYCYEGLFKRTLVETINVNVQYPAEIHIQSKHEKPLHENDTYSVQIKVEGNPDPFTSMTLEDADKVVDNKTGAGIFNFTVKNVQCIDGGQYTYVSKNNIGSDTKSEELLVYCPPSPRLPDPGPFQPRLGDRVDIKVHSVGYPYPNVTWIFKGKEVPCKTKHFESDLQVDDFKVDEYGTYTLRMENDIGQSNHSYEVVANGPPGQIKDLIVNNITETSANISWVPGYDYGAKQNFIIMSYNGSDYEDIASFEEKDGGHGLKPVSHVLDKLEPGMTYNLSVVANNSRGEGKMSKNSIAFTAAPYIRHAVVEHDGLFVDCNGTSAGAQVYWTNDAGTFRKDGAHLSIFNITRNYTGIYNCMEVVNTTIVTVENIYVDVQYPAKILSLKAPKPNVNVNDSYTFMVKLEGNPVPTTSLHQNDVIVFQANKTGMFNISVEHAECLEFQSVQLTSENMVGNDTRTEDLYVHCPPSPKCGIHKFEPRLGGAVQLKVKNVGYPYPQYTWTFNGKMVANETGDNEANITITDVKIDDFGVYTVKMTNDLGSATFNYSVIPYGPPEPVTKLAVNNITGTSANISFVSGYNYGAKQTFIVQTFNGETFEDIAMFEDKSKNNRPANVSHVINGLHYSTAYNLTVISNNSHGESERSSACVPFSTKDLYHVVDILEGGNLTLTCNGTNMTDVHWEDNHGKRVSVDEVLEVTGIIRNDTGFYKCVGKHDLVTRETIEEIFLDVQYPAKILNMSVDDKNLHINDTYTMELRVEGNPSPNITFIKSREGTVVFFSNTTGSVNITIDPVECTDLGNYQLIVNNQIASETETQNITVNCPPVVDPKANITTKFYPRLGVETPLKIENYGYPYPNYTWTHNKATIAKHKDSHFGSSVDINVTMDDFGSYDVDMSNEYGNLDFSFQIIAAGPPDQVTDIKVDNFTYNSAVLSWTSGYNYGNPQTFKLKKDNGKGTFIDFMNFTDKSDHGLERGNYQVTGLDSSTSYTFAVVSANANGTSPMTKDTVQFNTSDAPSHHKSNKKAIVGGVIGALCGLAVIVAIAIFLKRRRDRRQSYHKFDDDQYE